MNPWAILKIEPTEDEKVIKRAYVRLLKKHHPEEDPQGFQRLREAYEQASRLKEGFEQSLADGKGQCARRESEYPVAYADNEVNCDGRRNQTELAEEFMAEVVRIWEDATWRQRRDKWKELLDDECYWAIQVREIANELLLDFLLEKWLNSSQQIRKDIWQLLNQHFSWIEQNRKLRLYYPAAFIDFVVDQSSPYVIRKQRNDTKSEYTKKNIADFLMGFFRLAWAAVIWFLFHMIHQRGTWM